MNDKQNFVPKGSPHATRERLAFIEYRAFFCGRVKREEIESTFSISEQAATRDLQDYRSMAPGNLVYAAAHRAYVPTKDFAPCFPFEPMRVLSWLSSGFVHGLSIGKPARPVPAVRVIELGLPDLKVLSEVTRAIHMKRVIEVSYLSFSSGETRRQLVPHAIVDNGVRWHVRAYDRAKKRFADFVIARMASPTALPGTILEEEGVLEDHQWNRIVDLELVPHPDLMHPEVVIREFGMTDGVLRHRCRAAIVGYLLRLWEVDITPQHRLPAAGHHLWLREQAALHGVDSVTLAEK